MLIAITSNGKLGLGLVALLFIVFAILTAIVIPRSRPGFPGDRLPQFMLGALVLFVAMITAVVVFAKEGGEEEHAAGGESVPAETQPPATAPSIGSTAGSTETGSGEAAGDPAKGEPIFASAGCNSCHTLSAANATGTIGPNLDDAHPSFDKVVERVTEGKGVMPSFKGQLTDEQIRDVAAFVSESAKG